MKIGILCNSLSWGGLELFMGKLALWLQQAGKEVIIFCPTNSKIEQYAITHQLPYQPFTTQWKYADVRAMLRLKKMVQKNEITHFFIGHSKDISLLALTKKILGLPCKLIYPQQMQIGIDKKDILHTFYYRQLYKWISPLPWLKDNTLQRTNIAAEKIQIIPFGIDIQQFTNHHLSKEKARKQLNVPQNTLLAGIIGRLDPSKGHEYLLRALPLVRKAGIDAAIVIIGEESHADTRQYPQFLYNLVQELDINAYVYFRPFQEDVQVAFKALDAFVMASIAETYGYVTIEAMASGVPVVGAKAGGTAEIITDQVTGLHFENKNYEDLAAKLIDLFQNPERAAQLCNNAQKEVINKYDYRKQLDDMLA
jgi:glycosyltransferase involved in cell wall biosynthesis